MERLTNIHTHIFTGKCAPDHFFKSVLPNALDPFASGIKALIEQPRVRRLLRSMGRLTNRGPLDRYLEFIEVGDQSTQEEVLAKLLPAYKDMDPQVRIVVLPLNMDHMDVLPSRHARVDDQLREVERVRMHYPDQIFPFVPVDPRHKQGRHLVAWVEEKIERRAFFGIKLYPSLGFFPFDPALDELYAWAEQNQVPIMTHCTRYGTYYTGELANVLPHDRPATLNPRSPSMDSIQARVARFRASRFAMKDGKYGANVFLHPENYEPVLEKYQDLKLCLAHFGGDDQMLGEQHAVQKRGLDTTNWHDEVKRLMDAWPQVYTDISYTLYRKDVLKEIANLIDTPLGDFILFGTDFFMTLREDAEALMVRNCLQSIGPERFARIGRTNTTRYLRSAFYEPERRFSTAPLPTPASPFVPPTAPPPPTDTIP